MNCTDIFKQPRVGSYFWGCHFFVWPSWESPIEDIKANGCIVFPDVCCAEMRGKYVFRNGGVLNMVICN